jgi:hypothetical protein
MFHNEELYLLRDKEGENKTEKEIKEEMIWISLTQFLTCIRSSLTSWINGISLIGVSPESMSISIWRMFFGLL